MAASFNPSIYPPITVYRLIAGSPTPRTDPCQQLLHEVEVGITSYTFDAKKVAEWMQRLASFNIDPAIPQPLQKVVQIALIFLHTWESLNKLSSKAPEIITPEKKSELLQKLIPPFQEYQKSTDDIRETIHKFLTNVYAILDLIGQKRTYSEKANSYIDKNIEHFSELLFKINPYESLDIQKAHYKRIERCKFIFLLTELPFFLDELRNYSGDLFELLEGYIDRFRCPGHDAILLHLCKRSFQCTEEIAFQNVVEFRKYKFTLDEIQSLASFIENQRASWQDLMAQTGRDSWLIHAKDYEDSIPRTLQIFADGSIFLFFNKVTSSKKDPRIGDGKGYCKTVKHAIELKTGRKWCRNASGADEGRQEAAMARSIFHEHFISMRPGSVIWYNHKVSMFPRIGWITSFYNGGDLEEALKKVLSMSLEEKWIVANSLCEGLHWLHTVKKAVHRDIKTANIFLERDETTGKVTKAVIGDLGFCCFLEDESQMKLANHTPLYCSPEFFRIAGVYNRSLEQMKKVNGPGRDNWAAGVVLYQLFYRDPYWFSSTHIDDLEDRMEGYDENWLPDSSDPNSYDHTIKGLLRKDPDKRWNAGEASVSISKWRESIISSSSSS